MIQTASWAMAGRTFSPLLFFLALPERKLLSFWEEVWKAGRVDDESLES